VEVKQNNHFSITGLDGKNEKENKKVYY